MAESEMALPDRIRLIANRLGFKPRKIDQKFLRQIPYWAELMDNSAHFHQDGFEGLLNEAVAENHFASEQVAIPSLEQKLAGVQIAHRGKVLELSKPGTQKTIAALSAVVPIQASLPREQQLKTFITCPGYIIPTWTREIENLFTNPNLVVVTKENRERAIEKASDPSTNFVIVGYDMTFRKSQFSNGNSPSIPNYEQQYFNLFSKLTSLDKTYEYLEGLIGVSKTRAIKKRNPALPSLIRFILKEENIRVGKVLENLKSMAFPNGAPYYVIVDEFHNIVQADTKRANAIAQLALPARWLTLISGTGIGNTPEGLAWASYVLGFADNPDDFKRFIRDNPSQKVRAFIDSYAIHPIRNLSDVDPEVKAPVELTKTYDLSRAEMDLFTALIDAEMFDGKEKYLLFRYLIANPHKLLPENLAHLAKGDLPLAERIKQFFASNHGLEERVRSCQPSRISFARSLVQEIKEKGEKCVVVCEYQRGITEALEAKLHDLGVRRVDQTVSAEMQEIRLTQLEKRFLAYQAREDPSIFSGNEKYLSDLSPKAKKILNLKPYEIYGMSDRDVALHEFATNPDTVALVATRLLREGVSLKEAKYIIEFEETTIPAKRDQTLGRSIRSGQRRQVEIWKIRSPILEAVESFIEGRRMVRQDLIDRIHSDDDKSTQEQMHQWAVGKTGEKYLKSAFHHLTARDILGNHFNRLEGAGSLAYSQSISSAENALFIASLYNKNWAQTPPGNIALNTRDIILAIEKTKSVSLDRIVDAACGPLTVSRMLGRPAVNIDLNKHMMEFGIDACEDLSIQQNKNFLGDITDLRRLVRLGDAKAAVFEPGKDYPNSHALEDNSQDLVVASLVFDLLNQQGRYKFLKEAFRVLDSNRYLILVIPTKKIDGSYRSQFIEDVESCGFRNIDYFTGTWQAYSGSRRERIDAYVVLAEKDEANISATQPSLRLRPSTLVAEPQEQYLGRRIKKRKQQLTTAEYFVKVESGLELRNISREPTYNDRVKEIEANSSPRELTDVIREISNIISGSIKQEGSK